VQRRTNMTPEAEVRGASIRSTRQGQPAPVAPPLLEVLDVLQEPLGHEDSTRRRLERPQAGASESARSLRVVGWVVPRSSRVAAVEIMNGDRLMGRAELDQRRPDLAERFPDQSLAMTAGFRAYLNLIGLAGQCGIGVRAVLSDGTRASIGWFSVRPLDGTRASTSDRVSVIIPCFNHAHFLDEAIESALTQTYTDLEVVVVDDGSADNTREVAARYPGVRCVRQENRGVASARNAGLGASQGSYVVFLDADDHLLPRAIEIGVDALVDHPRAAFVAGVCRDVGVDGRRLPSPKQPLVTAYHYAALLESCFIWSGSSVVYRRSLLEEVGGFNQHLDAGDDYELYLNLSRRFPIHCHDTIVTEYRRHGSNMTRDTGLILARQLEVLRSQRRQLRNRAERAALHAGVQRTKREEGEALASELPAVLRRGDLEGARKRALVLARWYRRGLLWAVWRSVTRR
jgi:hypothetical protein